MKKEEIALVAPCGINCGDCGVHLGKDRQNLVETLVAMGFDREGLNKVSLPCAGCRAVEGNCPVIGSTCETYTCIAGRGFEFCFECPEFPCARLNPAADRANTLPHNTKVFNLCYIQRHGVDKFLQKAAEIKQRYYRGKMEVGKGPQLK